MIKLSIVVPIYKVQIELLEKCVFSLLKQTLKEIEIILVDDGSPNECRKKCDEFKEKNNCISVFHKTNGGVSSARNFGIQNAKGEYIGFVDADDYVKENFCETLYLTAKKFDADMVCSGYTELNDTTEISHNKKGNIPVVMDKNEATKQFLLFDKVDFRVWNKIFRKNIADKISFSEKYKIAEDEMYIYDFIALANKIVYIPYCGYYYFINSLSVMSADLSSKNFDSLKVTDIISDHVSDQKTENINYFRLNSYIRLWVKITSNSIYCKKFSKEKKTIEKKIRSIRISDVKPYNNKTIKLLFIPIKIARPLAEFVVKRVKFISSKVSL